jgi:hypothetical protein
MKRYVWQGSGPTALYLFAYFDCRIMQHGHRLIQREVKKFEFVEEFRNFDSVRGRNIIKYLALNYMDLCLYYTCIFRKQLLQVI